MNDIKLLTEYNNDIKTASNIAVYVYNDEIKELMDILLDYDYVMDPKYIDYDSSCIFFINFKTLKFDLYKTNLSIGSVKKIFQENINSLMFQDTYEYLYNYNTEKNKIIRIIRNKRITIPDYNPKINKRIIESGDMVEYNNKMLNYYDTDAIPFVSDKNFKTLIGPKSKPHTYIWVEKAKDDFRSDYFVDKEEYKELYGKYPSDPITIEEIEKYYQGEANFDEYFVDLYEDDYYYEAMDYDYVGRLWLDSKIITFWKYPNNINQLYKIVKNLEKLLNTKIWNNDWKIEVIEIKEKVNIDDIKKFNYDRIDGLYDDDDQPIKYEEKLIPLEQYDHSINPSEDEWIKHIDPPLKRKKVKVPYGFGSRNPKRKPLYYKQKLVGESNDDYYFYHFKNKIKNEFFNLKYSRIVIKINDNADRIQLVNTLKKYDLFPEENINRLNYLSFIDMPSFIVLSLKNEDNWIKNEIYHTTMSNFFDDLMDYDNLNYRKTTYPELLSVDEFKEMILNIVSKVKNPNYSPKKTKRSL